MKYSLDVMIITNNPGLRNAVKNILPDVNHPGVWGDEYDLVEDINENGDSFFSAMIRFNVKSERDGFTNSVKGLTGIINQCLDGSFVREHKCYHDDPVGKKCEIETILEP